MLARFSMQTFNALYRQLQGSVASREVKTCESRYVIKFRSGMGSAFMLGVVRCNILWVITMAIHGFLALFCALRRGILVGRTAAEIDGIIQGHGCKPTDSFPKGNPLPVLNLCTLFMLALCGCPGR